MRARRIVDNKIFAPESEVLQDSNQASIAKPTRAHRCHTTSNGVLLGTAKFRSCVKHAVCQIAQRFARPPVVGRSFARLQSGSDSSLPFTIQRHHAPSFFHNKS